MHELDQIAPTRILVAGRPMWRFADGTLLPVVSGGDGATDPPPPPPSDPPPPPPPPPADKGYPDHTPLEQMTVEQQAAYWKHQARKHEDRVKERSDYDDLKRKAGELDQLKASQMNEQEKAVEAAKQEARTEAFKEAGAAMVDAHIAAAVTGGRLTQEQADVLLEGLDRSKYLTSEHKVDTDKVKALLDKIATPAPGTGKGNFPDLGQGRRDGKVKPSVAAGRDLFEQSRTKTAAKA